MSSKKQRRKKHNSKKQPEETRTAEAVTVAWMLATFATFVAEIIAFGAWLLALPYAASQQGDYHPLSSLPGLLLYLAVITGAIAVILGVVTQRVRKQQAPARIKVFALIVGTAPLVAILALVLLNLR